MITYNGNEMMLQNDMGNTLIQDSATGNIMGLSEGFVPVGMKEHGGIIYIASVNKEGKGEIGTIPSPVLSPSLRTMSIQSMSRNLVTTDGPISKLTFITDVNVYPGEKFLPILNLNYTFSADLKFTVMFEGKEGLKSKNAYESRYLFSTVGADGCNHDGLYQLKLYSAYGSNITELQHVQSKKAQPFLKKDQQLTKNPFWFIPTDLKSLGYTEIGLIDINNIDSETTWLNRGFHTYPGNIPPGNLAIQAHLEEIDYFDVIKINQHKNSKQNVTKAPYISEINTDGQITYELLFPGFVYVTKSCRFIGSVEISLQDQKSQKATNLIMNEKEHEELCIDCQSDAITVLFDNVYQICSKSQKAIVPNESNANIEQASFVPLFTAKIGKNLNRWYTLSVKYYDQFGGYIDFYSFSFNPYHTLNYTESYYNITWQGDIPVLQLYDRAWDASSSVPYTLPDLTLNIEGDVKSIVFSPNSNITSDVSNLYTRRMQGDYDEEWRIPLRTYTVGENGWTTDNISCSYKPAKIKHSYLYPNDLAGTWKTKEITTTLTLSTQDRYRVEDKELSQFVAFNPSGVWDPDGNSNGLTDIFDDYLQVTQALYPKYTQKGVFSITRNLDTESSGQSRYSWPTKIKSVTFLDVLTSTSGTAQNPDVDIDAFMQWGIVTFKYDIKDQQLQAKGEIQVNNTSQYTLIPSFSFIGNTDDKANVALGYDRDGGYRTALHFEGNLYGNSMPKKSDSVCPSTFLSDGAYYKPADQGYEHLTPAGVYLIIVDIGLSKNIVTTDCGDKSTYGCNTQWNSQDGSPKIAACINGSYFQITRIDFCSGEQILRTFLPTLLYLPEDTTLTFEWKNVQQLQGIGLYRINQSIFYKDGSAFDEGNQIKMVYYQHPDLMESREIILPCVATYYEYAECLGRTFDFYPGVQNACVTNKHVVLKDSVKFLTKTDGSDLPDPTYIWDPEGDGIRSYIYKYMQENPTLATLGGLKSEDQFTLEYRQLQEQS